MPLDPDRERVQIVKEFMELWANSLHTAGIPRDIVSKLNSELIKILSAEEMKQRFAKQGTEVRTGTPDSLGQWLKTEQARWAKVVKESGEKFE